MKHISFLFTALLFSVFAMADIPAGYVLYGDVPSGYTDLKSSVTIGDFGGGYNGFQTSYIDYTGKGLGGHVGDGNYLHLSFSSAQILKLTTTFRVHIVMKKAVDSENDVQFSLCRDSWNSNRAGKTIPYTSLSNAYQEIVLSNSELTESVFCSIRTGDETPFAAGHVMRFCAVNNEAIHISQIYIENVFTPFAQSKNLGILRVKELPLYAESSTFVPTGSSVDDVDLYVVSIGQNIYARLQSTGNAFDAGFMDNYQVRTWTSAHTACQTGNASSKTNSDAMFTMVNGLFGIGDNADCYISTRAKLWGQNGIRCSEQLAFHGTYVCTPNGDKTAPTAAAAAHFDGAKYTVTFTASDNSGEMFYYVINETQSTEQISFVSSFVLNGAEEGDILSCYAVDFNGNMSAPFRVAAMNCDNCFLVQ
jgi:hypothetical protein